MEEQNYKETIRAAVSRAALYEQLAEECAELAHAALKAARKMRGENPTPVFLQDTLDEVAEEATDVLLVAEILGLSTRPEYKRFKIERWAKRLEGIKCDDVWQPGTPQPQRGRRLKDVVLE